MKDNKLIFLMMVSARATVLDIQDNRVLASSVIGDAAILGDEFIPEDNEELTFRANEFVDYDLGRGDAPAWLDDPEWDRYADDEL